MDKIIEGIIFGAVMFILGSFSIYKIQNLSKRRNATKSWYQAKGTVIESEVQSQTTRFVSNPIKWVEYFPHIKYVYTINNEKYSSTQLNYKDDLRSMFKSDRFHQIIKDHPAGAEVSVYYNPTSPSEAVLFQGGQGRKFLPLLASWIAIFIGVYVIIVSLSKL